MTSGMLPSGLWDASRWPQGRFPVVSGSSREVEEDLRGVSEGFGGTRSQGRLGGSQDHLRGFQRVFRGLQGAFQGVSWAFMVVSGGHRRT